MAQQSCGASVQACAMRVAVLEADGVPLPGAHHLYVTNALSKLEASPVYYGGVDIQEPNACGDLCVAYKARDQLVRYDLSLSICQFDPELELMLAGGEQFTSAGFTVGGSVPAIGVPGATYGVSLELWSKHIVGGDIDSVWPYIRWVFPRTYFQPDKVTFDNGPMTRDFTGFTSQNPNWFNGPANDWTFSSDRSVAWAYTRTLPQAVCGDQTIIGS